VYVRFLIIYQQREWTFYCHQHQRCYAFSEVTHNKKFSSTHYEPDYNNGTAQHSFIL